MDRAIMMICDMQYVMGRAKAISDANTLWAARMQYAMRICYGPRECDMRYASTLWAARMRYAICDMRIRYRPANAVCDARISYAQYANTLWLREYDMRYANRLRAMSNCKEWTNL